MEANHNNVVIIFGWCGACGELGWLARLCVIVGIALALRFCVSHFKLGLLSCLLLCTFVSPVPSNRVGGPGASFGHASQGSMADAFQTFKWKPPIPVLQKYQAGAAKGIYVEYLLLGHGLTAEEQTLPQALVDIEPYVSPGLRQICECESQGPANVETMRKCSSVVFLKRVMMPVAPPQNKALAGSSPPRTDVWREGRGLSGAKPIRRYFGKQFVNMLTKC